MNSADPSFTAQTPLLIAYHQGGYLPYPRNEMDLLPMSHADLNNKLNSYVLAQNGLSQMNLAGVSQMESPKKLSFANAGRKMANDQMAGLLALSQNGLNNGSYPPSRPSP